MHVIKNNINTTRDMSYSTISITMLIVAISSFLLWAISLYQDKYGLAGFGGGLAYAMISSFALVASLILSVLSIIMIALYIYKKQSIKILMYTAIFSILPIIGLFIMDYYKIA